MPTPTTRREPHIDTPLPLPLQNMPRQIANARNFSASAQFKSATYAGHSFWYNNTYFVVESCLHMTFLKSRGSADYDKMINRVLNIATHTFQ